MQLFPFLVKDIERAADGETADDLMMKLLGKKSLYVWLGGCICIKSSIFCAHLCLYASGPLMVIQQFLKNLLTVLFS